MQHNNAKQRWFSAWRGKSQRGAIDAADMGTAFGLDFSLDQPAAAPAPKTRRTGWLSRLVFRRKSAV